MFSQKNQGCFWGFLKQPHGAKCQVQFIRVVLLAKYYILDVWNNW